MPENMTRVAIREINRRLDTLYGEIDNGESDVPDEIETAVRMHISARSTRWTRRAKYFGTRWGEPVSSSLPRPWSDPGDSSSSDGARALLVQLVDHVGVSDRQQNTGGFHG